MKKWIRRIYASIFILIALIVIIVNVGMKIMRFTDNDAAEYFEERGFEGTIEDVIINEKNVKVVSDLPQEGDSILIVFVHGAPGSWDAFKEFITDEDLKSLTRIVAYDRPGYGGSSKDAMPGIENQSEILKGIIKGYGLKRNILVGHSYGGPIAADVGMDQDLDIDAVIMIAPLIDPISEPLHWYSYFSYWKLTSWLLPSELVVAGSEKFAHSRELEKITNKWQDAKCSFIHVHGLKDGLAPAKENIAFSKNHIKENKLETIVYEDKGHLLIWTDFDLMKEIILKAINNL